MKDQVQLSSAHTMNSRQPLTDLDNPQPPSSNLQPSSALGSPPLDMMTPITPYWELDFTTWRAAEGEATGTPSNNTEVHEPVSATSKKTLNQYPNKRDMSNGLF